MTAAVTLALAGMVLIFVSRLGFYRSTATRNAWPVDPSWDHMASLCMGIAVAGVGCLGAAVIVFVAEAGS